MDRDADDYPIRRLSRLGNELHLTGCLAVSDFADGHYEWGVTGLLLMKRCASDWIADGVIRRPATPTQTSSINALAASLGKPYATMHRYVTGLQKIGVVTATAQGYAISNDRRHEARILKLLTTVHDTVIRLADDLRAGGMAFETEERQPTALLQQTIYAGLDIWLVPFEKNRQPVGDWISQFVWICIAIANVRHITINDELSNRFSVHPTPDEYRMPVSVRQISNITGISYGSVFRHCQLLADTNVIHYDRGGWIITGCQLYQDDVDIGIRRLLAYYEKRIRQLAELGLFTNDVDSTFIDKRADYIQVPIA